MNETKTAVMEQLRELLALMQRSAQRRHHGGRMGQHSPHHGQGRVLAVLQLKPEISQRDLTYLLGMSKQAVAEVLAKLEKGGLVVRETSEEDRRTMTVRLTDAGSKAAEGVGSDEPTEADALAGFSDAELATFSDYIERMLRYYESQFPGEGIDERRRMMSEFREQRGRGGGHGRGRGGERGGERDFGGVRGSGRDGGSSHGGGDGHDGGGGRGGGHGRDGGGGRGHGGGHGRDGGGGRGHGGGHGHDGGGGHGRGGHGSSHEPGAQAREHAQQGCRVAEGTAQPRCKTAHGGCAGRSCEWLHTEICSLA